MGSGIAAPGRIVSLRHGPDDRVVGTFRGPAYPFRFTQVVSESPGVGKAQQQRLEKKALVASTRSFSHQRFATSL